MGYFLTFTCYGMWLHGDDRGSVDREHRSFETQRLVAAPARRLYVERFRMDSPPVNLDAGKRICVDGAMRYACERRNWDLHALNVRTNHVHAVITGGALPEAMLTSLKAWATRRLAEGGLIERGAKVWTRHGSTRYLWNPEDIAAAVWYVLDGQGPDLMPSNTEDPLAAGRSLIGRGSEPAGSVSKS